MELFKNSPLAKICLAAIIFMGISSVFFDKLLCVIFIISFLALSLIFFAITLVLKSHNETKYPHLKDRLLCFIVFGIITSIMLSGSYNFFISDIGIAKKYSGEIVEIQGSADHIRYTYPYKSAVEVNVSKFNGNNVKLRAIVEYEGNAPIDYRDSFTLKGKVIQISSEENYLVSDGFSLKIMIEDPTTIAHHGKTPEPWCSVFQHISDHFQNTFEEKTAPKTADLVGAMLLGNRENLDSETTRNFRRIGISHMLALSGLHVTVIMGFLEFILKRFNVSKKKRCAFLILGALFYLALTGFSLSAARAVIMISCVYLAYLFGDDSDSITALFLSAVIIFSISPSALVDIGFWMSFLATLGIIIVSKLLSPLNFKLKKKPVFIQLAVHLISALSVTLAATVAVSLFSWLVFGEISIIAMLTNLIFSPLTTAVLVGGVLLLIFAGVPFVGDFISNALDLIVDVFGKLSSHFAQYRGITVSMRYDFVKYIIPPMLILTLIFILIYLKRKWLIAIPTVAAIIAFTICILTHNTVNAGISNVTYIRNSKSEMLIVTNTESASICDISTGGYSHISEAYDEAVKNCATEIENIILTHYHQYHAGALLRMCKNYMIRNIYLPESQSDSDFERYNDIKSRLKNVKTNIVVYYSNEEIDLGGGCSIKLSDKYYIDRSVHSIYSVTISDNGEDIVYFSSSIYESEEFSYDLSSTEHIIFGIHGPNIHSAPIIFPASISKAQTLLLTAPEMQIGNNKLEDLKLNLIKGSEKYTWILDKKE